MPPFGRRTVKMLLNAAILPAVRRVPLPRELDAAIADLIDRGQGAQDEAVTLATQCGHGRRIGAVWSGYDLLAQGEERITH
jgi:hypothetical protein